MTVHNRPVSSIGFIGLGVMGAPMAGHLLKAYGSLNVWSRTEGRDQALVDVGATRFGSIAELAKASETIILCLNRTEDVESILTEIAAQSKGQLIIDHSTISPAATRRIHQMVSAKGMRFVDAPITGGSMGAQAGTLTIFCGGTEADVESAIDIIRPYSKRAERVGDGGSGQTMKMANQIAVGGALLALCESLSYAKKAGLDLQQTRSLLGGGAAGSWAFEHYGPKVLNQDWSPGFSIRNQRKDFGYCFESASELGAAVPGTQLIDRLLAVLDEDGHGDWTTCAVYETLLGMEYEP